METERSILRIKSEKFAVRIIKLYKHLAEAKKEFVLSKQILRSGTSIGANLQESKFAISKKEFLVKVSISMKECSETLYWLRLLKETDYITQKEFNSIYKDCDELSRMLFATLKTTKTKME
ncbi:MAG: four helix bundle protein [Rickettsiales bacterium]|jgi:four helix bundle protein|nr:four helix bundle protein [Rickettsiales bacterium]